MVGLTEVAVAGLAAVEVVGEVEGVGDVEGEVEGVGVEEVLRVDAVDEY